MPDSAPRSNSEYAQFVLDEDGTVKTRHSRALGEFGEVLALARRAQRLQPPPLSFLVTRRRSIYRVELEMASGSMSVLVALTREAAPHGLTPRELQVATCIAGGMTSPSVAESLQCTVRTVATHIESILLKTGAKTRSGIASLIVSGRSLVYPLPRGIEPIGELQTLAALMPPSEELTGAVPVRPLRTVRKRPITVASIFPARPDHRFQVESMRRGGQLAVALLNQAGGISGREIRLESQLVEPEELSGAVDAALDGASDALLLGNFDAFRAQSAIERVGSSATPLLHAMVAPALSAAVEANGRTLRNTFQVCATESAYIPGFLRTVNLLADNGSWRPANDRVALLLRESTADGATVDGIVNEIHEGGWRAETVFATPDQEPDWRSVIGELAERRPAAVYVSTFTEDKLRGLLEGLRGAGVDSLVYTPWSPASPDFTERLGDLAEGLVWSTVVGMQSRREADSFVKNYDTMFGRSPGLGGAAVHYDMVNILAAVWRETRQPWDFTAAADVLRRRTHHGLAGPYSFTGPGQRALAYPEDTMDASVAHAHLIYQIRQGRHVRLFPAA